MAKKKELPPIKVDVPKQAEAAVRTFDQIQAEFGSQCARAGHLQYQIFAFQKDLEMVNNQIRDLNIEAATLKAKENASKKEGV